MGARDEGHGISSTDQSADPESWAALGELYHRYLTGLVLALITRQGTGRAAEVVFRTFRRQHLELFLPGLAKLGLDQLPPAVACARYHVLSNALGGVRVDWIPESDRKSWVRYRPPRWIFDGPAVCGVPTEISRAMLRGWHGHNGVSLGNDRLGFVCTMQTTDGQPGLEGYYVEEDSPLDPSDRVRFRPGERPGAEPVPLPAPAWEAERLAKVERNYAMAYIRNILPELGAVLGAADAAAVGRVAGRQIGMQLHPEVMRLLAGGSRRDPGPFAHRFGRLLEGHGRALALTGRAATSGRAAPGSDGVVELGRYELFTGDQPPAVFEAWNGLWEGMAEMEGHRLVVTSRIDLGDETTTWLIRPMGGGSR